jgi:hypothetical protein
MRLRRQINRWGCMVYTVAKTQQKQWWWYREKSLCLEMKDKLGMVVCTCNPSYSGGWGRRITWVQEFGSA